MKKFTAASRRQGSWPRYVAAANCEDIRDRIMRRVTLDESGCWIWQSGRNTAGYGIITVMRQSLLAHRLSVLVFAGPFDPTNDIDHLCRVVACVNPDHLEPVSHFENVQRGTSVGTLRDACVNGHPYSPETHLKTARGRSHRVCATCQENYIRPERVRVRPSRAKDPARPKRAAGLCPNGHQYSDTNTSIAMNGNKRCKTCHNERCARARARRAQKLSA